SGGTWTWTQTAPVDEGDYTITIQASIDEGCTATKSFVVHVTDVPPTITGSGPSHACLGDTVMASGTFSDYDDAVTISASVDGGAYSTTGITQDSGKSGSWSWSSSSLGVGDHTIIVTATNADGSSASTPVTFTVDVDSVSVAADNASVSTP